MYNLVSIWSNKFCEKQAIPYLLPTGKFGHNALQYISISPAQCFNQRLLNFSQYFASDVDYIFFISPVYEQHRLLLSINFAMHKVRPGTLTTRIVKYNLKGTVERFLASDKVFSFMSPFKGTPTYWKQFLFDVLAMVKQLGISTYSFAFSCAKMGRTSIYY